MRALALLVCAAVLAAVEVRLRPLVEVSAPFATLGDCAEIVAGPELQTKLAACTLVELPDLGQRQLGEREVLAACARAAGRETVTVVGTCKVGRRTRVVTTDELVAAAKEICPQAEIQVLRTGSAITAPAGGTLRIKADALDPALVGEVPFRVRVLVDDGEVGRTLVSLRIRRFREICVTTRALARGEAIATMDVRRERREITRQDALALDDPGQVVGKVARLALASGTAVLPLLIDAPPVIRAGEPVSLIFRGPGFEVMTAGTALADARGGEHIGVRRDTDSAVLRGLVDGPGRVIAERR